MYVGGILVHAEGIRRRVDMFCDVREAKAFVKCVTLSVAQAVQVRRNFPGMISEGLQQ